MISLLLFWILLAFSAAENGTFVSLQRRPDTVPEISPAFDFNGEVEKGLQEHLPLTQSTIHFWTDGRIPADCKNNAEIHGYNATEFDVLEVTYRDCTQPWIMCRLKTAKTDSTAMADTFGKMPLGMREFVKHVIIMDVDRIKPSAAYSTGDTIVAADEYFKLYILTHEISHSIDSHATVPGVTPPEGGGGLSVSKAWMDLFNHDTAAVTRYARSSWPENLAESGVVALFDIVVPGGVGTINPNWTSVFRQYGTYKTHYGHIVTPGAKSSCTHRIQDSEIVRIGNGNNNFQAHFEGPTWYTGPKLAAGIQRIPLGAFHNLTFVNPLQANSVS
ncbi:hypothetical protein AAE478_008223 [Parahypoxylon ruwenzoriense]